MKHFLKHFPKIIFTLLAIFVLSGCKTDEEKRLDELYARDNVEIAKNTLSGIYTNAQSYRDINQQCAYEKEKKITNGKWCTKINQIRVEEDVLRFGHR